MADKELDHPTTKTILDSRFFTLAVYTVPPNCGEGKHFHIGDEWVYTWKGGCKTQEHGGLYHYGEGEVHQVVNDSPNNVVFLYLTIPQESEKNTIYCSDLIIDR